MEQQLQQLEKKYFDLVWYARKPRDADGEPYPMHIIQGMPGYEKTPDDIIKSMMQAVMKVRAAYPRETDDLNSEEVGDWAHGFNSGALAAFRWVMTANELGVSEADDEFPFLDT